VNAFRNDETRHSNTGNTMRLSTFAAFLVLALPAGAFAQDAATPASSAAPAASTAPAAAAPANPAPASAPVGDAARGKPLTYTCQGCHGITGYKNAYPNYHVPRIGGQSAQYLTNALMEYRAGKRKHPTMQAQAQSFSEQDIADIAAYLSGIDK
jgi:cytochrome c553